jgi:hypothetical protein
MGGREFVTISSTPAQITPALAKPAGAAVRVGAYLELLSFGCFLAFAVWACAKLGGGLRGSIARASATGYATVGVNRHVVPCRVLPALRRTARLWLIWIVGGVALARRGRTAAAALAVPVQA